MVAFEFQSTRFMFLIQLVQVESPKTQRLELLAINLSDCFSIKVIQSHDIPVDFAEYVLLTQITHNSK